VSLESVVHRERPAAGEPEGALVLLHGRATDENDLFPLLEMLDPERRLAGYTLRGPLNLPPGGWHWYSLAGIPTPDPTTFTRTFAQLSDWLDSLGEETGVPMDRTVLGGFSQGSVMAYALALGAGRPKPAGLLAMSGFIPTVEGFELDLEGRTDLPVAITHGTQDPVISVQFARDAKQRLEGAGFDVLYRESPMAHSIDPRTLPELERFVADAVDR
jgi:phospholipase/carboxylesterase